MDNTKDNSSFLGHVNYPDGNRLFLLWKSSKISDRLTACYIWGKCYV